MYRTHTKLFPLLLVKTWVGLPEVAEWGIRQGREGEDVEAPSGGGGDGGIQRERRPKLLM